MANQLLFAFIISVVIAGLAYWRNSLSRSGAVGALLVGFLTFGFGGWQWGVLLGIFFVSSSLLSHYKESEKKIASEKFDKGHRRDFGQVMANGGLGAVVALLSSLLVSPIWLLLFVGIMATVTADTWATELGTLSKRPPRLITTGRVVEVGTSGGVSLLGTAVSASGGFLIGITAGLLTNQSLWLFAVLGMGGGLAGSLFDSLLGATVQRVYYCEIRQRETEKKLNPLGEPNNPIRGWAWMNNDLVNLAASLIGGVIAVLLFFIVGMIFAGADMAGEKLPTGFTLRHTLKANNRAITRIAWSPDGRMLASASYDQKVRIWDAETGQQIEELYGYSGSVFTVCITPDGRFAISASKSALKVWDITHQSRVRTLRGHDDYVYAVAVTPDGRFAISGAYDETIRVWNLSTDSEHMVLKGHSGRVGIVLVTPDGRMIVSGAGDARVRLWHFPSGRSHAVLSGHKGEILSLAVTPDNQYLASAAHDGDIRLWRLENGALEGVLSAHTKPVTGVSFSADGRLLASKSADGTVRLWRRDTWQCVTVLEERHSTFAFSGLAFHPQLPVLATLGDKDKIIRIWDIQPAKLQRSGIH